MTTPLNGILQLEQLDTNLYRSTKHCENYRQALYGGQVLSQALTACFNTVDSLLPHSLHAYFLRPGTSEMPVIYDVESVRDGRSIVSRRCVARQKGRPILNMSASFHREENGPSHQETLPDWIPSPEETDPQNENGLRMKEFSDQAILNAFDIRPIKNHKSQKESESQFWLKHKEKIDAGPITHLCSLAFASDIGLMATAIRPYYPQIFDQNIFAASIDHAMWFHSSNFSMDNWLLFQNTSPWSGNSRGYTRSSIYSHDKKLIASVTQEGLIRLP